MTGVLDLDLSVHINATTITWIHAYYLHNSENTYITQYRCRVALRLSMIRKAPVLPQERCCSVPGAVIFFHSLLFNKRWPPLRKHRIRSATAYSPSYRSESFKLHKILQAVRKGQFSAKAKFTAATTTNQSLARHKFVDA